MIYVISKSRIDKCGLFFDEDTGQPITLWYSLPCDMWASRLAQWAKETWIRCTIPWCPRTKKDHAELIFLKMWVWLLNELIKGYTFDSYAFTYLWYISNSGHPNFSILGEKYEYIWTDFTLWRRGRILPFKFKQCILLEEKGDHCNILFICIIGVMHAVCEDSWLSLLKIFDSCMMHHIANEVHLWCWPCLFLHTFVHFPECDL